MSRRKSKKSQGDKNSEKKDSQPSKLEKYKKILRGEDPHSDSSESKDGNSKPGTQTPTYETNNDPDNTEPEKSETNNQESPLVNCDASPLNQYSPEERDQIIEERRKRVIERFDAKKDQAEFERSPHFDYYKQKVDRLVKNHYNREIEKRVNAILETADPRIKNILINKTAFEKGKYIAESVSNLAGQPLEVSVAMASKLGSENLLVTDLYVVHAQDVRHAHCAETPLGKILTHEEMEKNGEYRSGWMHSHADFHRHFSAEDNHNLRKDARKGTPIKIDLLDDEKGSDKMEVEVTVYTALVFNQLMKENDKPHTGVVISYTPLGTKQKKTSIYENVGITIVDDGYCGLDKGTIDNQLMERVNIEGQGKLADIAEDRQDDGSLLERLFMGTRRTVSQLGDLYKQSILTNRELHKGYLQRIDALNKRYDEQEKRILERDQIIEDQGQRLSALEDIIQSGRYK